MATRKAKGTGFIAVDEVEFRTDDFDCSFQPSNAKPTTTTVTPTTPKPPTTTQAPTTIPPTTVEPTEPPECKYYEILTFLIFLTNQTIIESIL